MISLCMIVKNEEQYLDGCIKSVKGLADEIILVDTGSSDRTKEIAKTHNVKIFDYEWRNDFSAARNYSIQKASGDWILYLDADERLSEKSVGIIKNIVSGANNTAFECKIINIDGIKKQPSIMKYPRFFPNKKGIKFEGKVHEQIENSILDSGCEIVSSEIEIIHLGYNLSDELLRIKAERNLQLLMAELSTNKSGYIYFQLGQTYHILNEEEKAIENFKQAIKDNTLRAEYAATALRSIAVHYAEIHMYQLSLSTIEESLKLDFNQPLSHLAASKIYMKMGLKENAVKSVLKAFSLNDDFINGRMQSSQSIMADSFTIIYTGLNISLLCNDSKRHDYFLQKFKADICNNGLTNFYKIYVSLISNDIIDDKDINNLVEFTNDSNLELILNLLNKHTQINFVCKTMLKLEEKFITNTLFLNAAGLKLAQNKDLLNANRLLTLSYNINPGNSATILYLVSICIQQNKLHDAITIIEDNIAKFKEQPEVFNKFNLVLQKLSQAI